MNTSKLEPAAAVCDVLTTVTKSRGAVSDTHLQSAHRHAGAVTPVVQDITGFFTFFDRVVQVLPSSLCVHRLQSPKRLPAERPGLGCRRHHQQLHVPAGAVDVPDLRRLVGDLGRCARHMALVVWSTAAAALRRTGHGPSRWLPQYVPLWARCNFLDTFLSDFQT